MYCRDAKRDRKKQSTYWADVWKCEVSYAKYNGNEVKSH